MIAFWPLLCLLFIVGASLLLPALIDPLAINPDAPLHAPSLAHWLGTDDLGRDLLSRSALGAQLSLGVGLSTALLATIVGGIIGMWSGYKGGLTDQLTVRLMDVLYSLPLLMVVILLSLWLGRGIPSLIVALSLFCWPDTARLIRAYTQQLVKLEFVEAFHSLGGNTLRLFVKQLLPNVLRVVLVSVTMLVPRAIMAESTLSFIGLGVEPPLSSWGTLTSEGWQLVRVAPHLLLIPAFLIIVTMGLLQTLSQQLEKQWLKNTG